MSIFKCKSLKGIYIIGSFMAVTAASAQDTTQPKIIDITSVFKPFLREGVKINFQAAPPPADTTKPRLNYNIPNQNLYFTYEPIPLKPLAMQIDSMGSWDYHHFIKLGFGMQSTPFVKAGFSFGNKEGAALNIMADHISSKGGVEFQNYSNTNIGATGSVRTASSNEWSASLKGKLEQYYRYGFPEGLTFDKSDLSQRFQTISGRIGFRNLNPTEFGLTYQPDINLTLFSDERHNNETSAKINLPLQKGFGDQVNFHLGITADLTRYSRDNMDIITNNLFYINPAVRFHYSTVNLHAGIRPSWDNGSFHMLPDVRAEISTNDQRFTVQAGWIGEFNKVTYQYLAGYNPWLERPDELNNTRRTEFFGGIKGSAGSNFAYGAKVGFIQFHNMPLFVNDLTDGKSFEVINEPEMKALHLSGEFAYTRGESFSARATAKIYQFSGLQQEEEPWGLIPAEITATLRWELLRDLYLKSDLFIWEGPQFRKNDGTPGKLGGAFDLNAGLEFKATRSLDLWLQMNNIFNNKYQRWSQYPVYGFNVLGGIIYSFGQK